MFVVLKNAGYVFADSREDAAALSLTQFISGLSNGALRLWKNLAVNLMLGKKVTQKHTLPKTNMFTPENGWLEYDRFLLGWWLSVSGMVVLKKTPWMINRN